MLHGPFLAHLVFTNEKAWEDEDEDESGYDLLKSSVFTVE